jgi:hypothetical protein
MQNIRNDLKYLELSFKEMSQMACKDYKMLNNLPNFVDENGKEDPEYGKYLKMYKT